MRAAWVEVDLDAYAANLRAMMAHAGRPALGVVKANGYGHGIDLVAPAALEAGCEGLAVALPEEGSFLRSFGLLARIVVLGLALEDQAEQVVADGLEPVVTREEVLRALSEEGRKQRKRVRVHVKVDTGMTRVGIEPEDALAFCRRVAEDPHLELAGVATHFASAEDEDLQSVEEQWSRFEPLQAELARWSPRPVLHAANSAASVWFPPARLDWIRAGLLSYGVPPAPRELPFPVRPVASLKARIVQVREVPAGRAVSYGGTWTTERPSRLALVPLGYGDGLPWALANKGVALVGGRRVPIRGRVCMDQVVLDVTEVPPVRPGDEAVFIGRQGEEQITVPEVAGLAGTITYEVLTRLAARLPRKAIRTDPCSHSETTTRPGPLP